MFDTITLDTDARGVARLTLNRPDKHNAMSAAMIAELTQAAAGLAADNQVRVVVLAGQGPSFCAGGDLRWMRDQMGADDVTREAEARKLAYMLRALDQLPQPLIGRIHGGAFGGGVGLASVCDVAIGVTGAKMGLTETRLGLIPATIGPYVVARMGAARARRVFMSSRRFETAEALDLGLLARVVDPSDLNDVIEAEVAPYLSCAPGAVADAKALIRAINRAEVDEAAIEASIAALVTRWQSDEAKAGVAAFFDKQSAPWAASLGT